MKIPIISLTGAKSSTLLKRKGGGGHGSGGGDSGGGSSGGRGSGTGSSGGSSSGSGSSGSGGGRSPVSIGSGGTTGGRTSATPYGNGGGKQITVPSGQPFAGRTEGGGSRSQVFGTRTYGSGYPSLSNQRGVDGLGFPFYFWPVVWGTAAGAHAGYLHDNEYGDASNSTRPGGALTTAPFSSSSGNTTLHVIADNATTTSLISSITSNCTSFLASNSTGNITAKAFNPNASGTSEPEQAIQYYRASSVVLTLDGYNDTAALSNSSNTPDTPLPNWLDTNMLNCVNQTIGAAVPLINCSIPLSTGTLHGTSILGIVWLMLYLFSILL